MCGRYNIVTDAEALMEAFDVMVNEFEDGQLAVPRYNIPPASTVPIVRMDGAKRTLSPAHWGLLPPWAKDRKLAFRTFNARSESIADKASFRVPVRRARCIVPASGWYEWRREGDVKQPYYFQTGGLIPFAGVSAWHPDFQLLSCSIITTPAGPVASRIHHRMPAVLEPQRVDGWMAAQTPMTDVLSMLRPYEGHDLTITRVSTKVNSTRYHEPDCVEGVLLN